MRPTILAALATAVLFAAAVRAAEDWRDLPPGPGRTEVIDTCRPCHSLMIVTQQGLDRADWDESIDEMVEEHGMPRIDDAERGLIVDYLAAHFGRDRALPARQPTSMR